jgi:hypothetical protein
VDDRPCAIWLNTLPILVVDESSAGEDLPFDWKSGVVFSELAFENVAGRTFLKSGDKIARRFISDRPLLRIDVTIVHACGGKHAF